MRRIILIIVFLLVGCVSTSTDTEQSDVKSGIVEESVEMIPTPKEDTSQSNVDTEIDNDQDTSEEDVIDKEASEEASEDPIFQLLESFEPDSIGPVGMITTISRAGTQQPLWRDVTHEIFNQFDLFDQTEFDTIFVAYERDLLRFFPPSTWGVNEILPDEIIVTNFDDKKIILVHFPESEFEKLLSMVQGVDYRILGLNNSTTLTEYLEWQTANPLAIEEIVEPPTPIGNSAEMLERVESLDVCQLRTTKTHPNGSQLGFPYVTPFAPNRGDVNVIVAPIDFSNAKGDPLWLSGLAPQVKQIENWADYFTGGQMSYNVTVVEEWLTYEKGSDYFPDYTNAFYNPLQNPEQTKVEILELIRTKVEVRDADIIYLIFPQPLLEERKVILYGQSNLQLSDGTRIKTSFYGNERPEANVGNYWSHLLHESLHFQGFVGHGPAMFNTSFTIMNRDNAGARGILSWEAFLVGWFDEEDIACISKANLTDKFELELLSIDELGSEGGLKSLMIRLSESKILVIESRGQGTWSLLGDKEQGIIAYVIDITKTSQYPPPPGINSQIELDKINFWYHLYDENNSPIFRPSTLIEFEGIKINILSHNRIDLQLIN